MLAAAMAAAEPVAGDTFTYVAGGTNRWSDPGNWVDGLIPASDAGTSVVLPAGNYVTSVDNSRASWMLNRLTLAASPDARGITIQSSTSLLFTGTAPTLENQGGVVTIAGPLKADTLLTFVNSGGSAGTEIAVQGNLSAPALLLRGGSLSLTGNNTLPGGITVQGTGFVRLYGASSAGAGPVTFDLSQQAAGVASVEFDRVNSNTVYSNDLVVVAPDAPGNEVDLGQSTAGSLAPASLTASGTVSIHGSSAGAIGIAKVSLGGTTDFYGGFSLSTISGAGSLSVTHGTTTLGSGNTYAGKTIVNMLGLLVANAPGALGPGAVTLADGGTLELNVSGAAHADVTVTADSLGTLIYNANEAAGGHVVSAPVLMLGAITSVGNDTFVVSSGQIVLGSGAALGLLTRGGNITLAPGSMVEAVGGGMPTIQNLGTNADLVLAVGTATATTVTVGQGTAWGGFAGGPALDLPSGAVTGNFVGTITPTSAFSLAGGFLGNGNSGSFNITGATPVMVTVSNATLVSPLSDYSGVSSFHVTGTLSLVRPNDLGGGGSGALAPVTVAAGGTLDVFSGTAINAPVTLRAGSTLIVDSGGLSGSGMILRDAGGITFVVRNAGAFSGTQLTPALINPGDTIRLEADAAFVNRGLPLTISAVTADTRHTLTLQGVGTQGAFQITAALAGDVDVVLTNAVLTLSAAQDPAAANSILVNADAALELGASYDFSTPLGPTLAGTGLVIVDAGTTLALAVDSAFAGTIEVNGTLLLEPARDPANADAGPRFAVVEAPEPASAMLLLAAGPILLSMRRRR